MIALLIDLRGRPASYAIIVIVIYELYFVGSKIYLKISALPKQDPCTSACAFK